MADFLFIPNGSAGNLLVCEPDGSAVLATVSAPFGGADVIDAAVTPDGLRLFVAYATGVKVLDAIDHSEITTITGFSPKQISMNPAGTFLYVAAGAGMVVKVNTSSYAVTTIFPTDYSSVDLIAVQSGGTTPGEHYIIAGTASSEPRVSVLDSSDSIVATWDSSGTGGVLTASQLAWVGDVGYAVGSQTPENKEVIYFNPGVLGWGEKSLSTFIGIGSNDSLLYVSAVSDVDGDGELLRYVPSFSPSSPTYTDIDPAIEGSFVGHGKVAVSRNTAKVAVTTATGKILIRNSSSTGSFTTVAADDPRWIRYLDAAAVPVITSFTPASGPVGTLVTVTGKYLSGATQKFHDDVSATLDSNTSTQTVAPVPEGAVTGPIVITTDGGTATSASDFTVTAPSGSVPVMTDDAEITFARTGHTYHTLEIPALIDDATSWKLFKEDGTLIEAGLAGGINYEITGLTPGTRYGYKLKATNATGDSVEFSDTDHIRTNLTASAADAPSAPDAPTAEKSCALGRITVTDSAWEPTDAAPISSAGLRRRVNGVTIEELAPGWNSDSGTYADDDVQPFDIVEYSVNRSNGAGSSDWSAWSTPVVLQSSTTLVIVSPATGSLTGTKQLRMSASGAVTNPRVLWNGVQIGVPTLESGYYVFSWKTYQSAQGAGTLRFQTTGTDGCEAKAEEEYTLANGLKDSSAYLDVICRENVAPEGQRVRSASFGFQVEPLPANPDLRYRLRVAAYLDDLAADAAFGTAFDEETWDAGQHLILSKGRELDDGTAQYHWFDYLAKIAPTVGERLIFRLRWDAEETAVGYSTYGAASGSRILKIRDDGAADAEDYRVLLLAVKDDLSGARIYEFDGDDLSLLVDLSDHDASAAFDFAVTGDKLFVATAFEMFYVDLDSGEASGNLAPRGETRAISFLESVDGNLFAIFVDAAATPKTQCYRWSDSWKAVWTLDDAVTAVNVDNGALAIAAGAKLYTSQDGATAPTLLNTFAADVTVPHAAIAGLSDGKVMQLVNGAWVQRIDRAGAIEALGEYSGATHETDNPRAVAGEDSTTLLEATADPATWSDSRVLATPALMTEDLDGVTALHRFLKQSSVASGTEGTPDYVPADYREILLVGTSPDGLLLAIETSDIVNDVLAIPAAQVSAIRALPILEDVPEE